MNTPPTSRSLADRAVAPNEEYIALSLQEPKLLKEPRSEKPLLILDLNGTLISRTGSRSDGTRNMYVRPYHNNFLDFAFTHFSVMVWSSARPHSVTSMCTAFGDYAPKLVQVWDRTHFELTEAEYNRNTTTIKDLNVVWNFWNSRKNDNMGNNLKAPEYDARNTILLDDSPIKTVVQPYNALHISTFHHCDKVFTEHGERELLNVIQYLDAVRKYDNICAYVRKHPYRTADSLQDPEKENSTLVYHYQWNGQVFDRQLEDLGLKEEAQSSERSSLNPYFNGSPPKGGVTDM